MQPPFIRVIAICLFRRGDELLVMEGYDRVKGDRYYRPPGGGVEPGETTVAAIKREIREELDADVVDLRRLGALENIFTCDGGAGHEIVFVYEGRFADEAMYEGAELAGIESNGEPLRLVWRRLDAFDAHHRLVPEPLAALLAAEPSPNAAKIQ